MSLFKKIFFLFNIVDQIIGFFKNTRFYLGVVCKARESACVPFIILKTISSLKDREERERK